MTILILNLNSQELHKLEFIRPVEDILKENYEVKDYSSNIDFNKYTHIIICGVALKDFKYEEFNFDWLKNYNGKVLGICAGAQIISSNFENSLKDKQEIGLQKVEIVSEVQILNGLKSPLEIYGLHNKSFDSLNNFEIILKGEEVEMIKHKEKEIYGCLFHPEVRNKEIIENFINL